MAWMTTSGGIKYRNFNHSTQTFGTASTVVSMPGTDPYDVSLGVDSTGKPGFAWETGETTLYLKKSKNTTGSLWDATLSLGLPYVIYPSLAFDANDKASILYNGPGRIINFTKEY